MSFSPTPTDGFEDWEIETANVVVRGFIATRGSFARHDIDDLVQECLLHWWEQRGSYVDGRGANPRTYMNRVLTNKLRDLRRAESAQRRRGDLHPLRLDEPLHLESGATLADVLEADAPGPESEALRSDLADRADRLRARLPQRQRRVWEEMATGVPPARIALDLGISRDTVYEDIRRIRDACRDSGLEEYL